MCAPSKRSPRKFHRCLLYVSATTHSSNQMLYRFILNPAIAQQIKIIDAITYIDDGIAWAYDDRFGISVGQDCGHRRSDFRRIEVLRNLTLPLDPTHSPIVGAFCT